MIDLSEVEIEQVKAIDVGTADLTDFPKLYDKLYESLILEMPYGTAKGRTGDPVEWITDHLHRYLDF